MFDLSKGILTYYGSNFLIIKFSIHKKSHVISCVEWKRNIHLRISRPEPQGSLKLKKKQVNKKESKKKGI